MFTAKYLNRKTGETYYRTVHADTINDASSAADRYANKGFICSSVTKKEGASHD